MDAVNFRFGFWAALIAFIAALGYSIVQVVQVLNIVAWPWDAIGIFGFSLLISWPFMLAMLALRRATPEARRIWSEAAVLFAVIYAAYVGLMYSVQLATAIPLQLRGAPNPLFEVSRYSLFWTLDAMGYINMGIATLFASAAFPPEDRWIRFFFRANGVFTAVVAVVYFYPVFSIPLLLLASPWIVTCPGSLLLLTAWFRRRTTELIAPQAARMPGGLTPP